MVRKWFRPVVLLALVVVMAAGWLNVTPAPAQEDDQDYWPAEAWRTSSPEAQGMDSARLATMFELIASRDHNINSVLVIRHGYLVAEAYPHPNTPDVRHIIHSCTKSVTSVLVGIAAQQGYLEGGVDMPLLDIFSDWEPANRDELKESIRLEDLLMMASGLDCRDSYLYRWRGLNEMRASSDWIQHMLDLPMAEEPGTAFEYCNGGSFLVGAVVQELTGIDTGEFADEFLFGPLGITDYYWHRGWENRVISWGGLEMLPRDMARIGYLYLHNGVWNGQQIVSEDWVAASSAPQIEAGTLNDSYGYQWWVNDDGWYSADGYAGQFIFVVPEHDLVVVFTSGLPENDFFVPQDLLRYYIISSIADEDPLPENPDALETLEAAIDALENPAPQPVPPLPDGIEAISGQRYEVNDENDDIFDAFSMTFTGGASEMLLTTEEDGEVASIVIGLDGVYRLVPDAAPNYPQWIRARWQGDNVMIFDILDMISPTDGTFRVTFREDGTVSIRLQNPVTSESATWTGRLAQAEASASAEE